MVKKNHLVCYALLLLLLCHLACKSDERSLPKPGEFDLVAPVDSATGVALIPVFIWQTSDNASSYKLIISLNSDFSGSMEVADIQTNSYQLQTELAANTRYFWKVVSVSDGGEQSAVNSGLCFRTLASPPNPSPGISVYHVSPEGDDNPGRGTREMPFKTLAYAATMVPPGEGDTIKLSAGTFVETEPALIPVGVHVKGAGENATIISSRGVKINPGVNTADKDFKLWYDGSLIQLVSPGREAFRIKSSPAIAPEDGNQTISGFTIDGNGKKLKAGIWVENRNNVTMHHVSFRNIQQRGAVFAAGNKNWYVYPDYYVKNIKIHDCTFENCGKDLTDETLGNLNIAQLENSEIYNLKISDTEGYGLKFIFDGYFRNLKIHDCQISLNETDSKWGEDISIELWNVGPGNEIYNIQCNTWISVVNHAEIFGSPVGCENMKIYNVRMIDKDGSGNIEGIEIGAPGVEVSDVYIENKGFGFAIWDMGRENILLHHNIIYNSSIKNNWAGAPAIYIDNSRTWNFKNIGIYNNIFDLHPVGIRIKGNNIGEIEIKNNIFLNSGKEVESTASRVIFSHNLRNGRNSSDWILTGQFETSGNLISDPGFLQSGNRWESFYKPSGSSATVDKGTNVGLPFKGNNPDIGKWEYEN